MKKLLILVIALSLIFACNESGKDNEKKKKVEIEVRKGNFYTSELDSSADAIVLADTIRYSVTIKNPDPEDYWTEADIRRMDELALANIIFNAIYNKRLTAYDFFDNTPMTVKQVKELEQENPRSTIGRMLFEEEWYFDENNLQFGKKINAIMLAYQKISADGTARYIPAIMVYLNDKSKNPPQKDSETK